MYDVLMQLGQPIEKGFVESFSGKFQRYYLHMHRFASH